MILSSHGPPTSSPPPANRRWKTTTVDDVVRLIKLAEGRDPAWRFLEIRQIDESRGNVARLVSVPERETGNGLWATQRLETIALMQELTTLCDGEPERRWGAELGRLEELRRTDRTKSALTARHRKERMIDIAGNFIGRQKQE